MQPIHEIEVQLKKTVADIEAQARMLALDECIGATASVAIARFRAIEEYAARAEKLLGELNPGTELFGNSRQAS